MSDWIEGTVQHVVYTAPESGYAVVRLLQGDSEHTVVGYFADAMDELRGNFLTLEGVWERHPVHGRQFRATGSLSAAPRTLEGLKLYLASSGLPGIGEVLAGRIVDVFGLSVLTILSDTPERLTEVDGIGQGRAKLIFEKWSRDEGERALVIRLRGLGVSQRIVARIRVVYGEHAARVVREEPYRLSREVSGIGFKTADQLALAQGGRSDDPERARAAVMHALQEIEQRGHCFASIQQLRDSCRGLDVPEPLVDDAVKSLADALHLKRVDHESGAELWRSSIWIAEDEVALALRERSRSQMRFRFELSEIEAAEKAEGIRLDGSQRNALRLALENRLAIITGGPGTGKTTILRVYMRLMERAEREVVLSSPTGRAARRLAAATGRPASTLHRLLDARPDLGGFQRSRSNPLDVDGIVIDEMSMVDLQLAHAFLNAIRDSATVLMVGDPDQLPSVGPGSVLRDCIRAGSVPVAQLTTVHRQAEGSGIIDAAKHILSGELPPQTSSRRDFFAIRRDSPERVLAGLHDIVNQRLGSLGYSERQIQVLSPSRKGALGTHALNEALRDWLNPNGEVLRRHGREFRVGDRVLCTQNQHDLEVYNGDIGYITGFGREGVMIEFEDRLVRWAFDDLRLLDLGYAITIHKSQGSEYPVVVVILHSSHGVMLQRNLMYTATTRASQFCCYLGDEAGWARAVESVNRDARNTRLVVRLNAL